MKINLKDVTFIIPLLIDSKDRLSNIKFVLNYMSTYLDTNIIIAEQESDCKEVENLPYEFRYIKIDERDDSYNHRTRQVNIAFKHVKTLIVSLCDTDAIVKPEQYFLASSLINNKKADVCYPYDNYFYDIKREYHFSLINRISNNNIEEKILHWKGLNSKGGMIFINSDKFREAGMENENFINYGLEDKERCLRYYKLRFKIKRIQGNLYHLYHKPSFTSKNNEHFGKEWMSDPQYITSKKEYNKIIRMDERQLKDYIKTWSWIE